MSSLADKWPGYPNSPAPKAVSFAYKVNATGPDEIELTTYHDGRTDRAYLTAAEAANLGMSLLMEAQMMERELLNEDDPR